MAFTRKSGACEFCSDKSRSGVHVASNVDSNGHSFVLLQTCVRERDLRSLEVGRNHEKMFQTPSALQYF